MAYVLNQMQKKTKNFSFDRKIKTNIKFISSKNEVETENDRLLRKMQEKFEIYFRKRVYLTFGNPATFN